MGWKKRYSEPLAGTQYFLSTLLQVSSIVSGVCNITWAGNRKTSFLGKAILPLGEVCRISARACCGSWASSKEIYKNLTITFKSSWKTSTSFAKDEGRSYLPCLARKRNLLDGAAFSSTFEGHLEEGGLEVLVTAPLGSSSFVRIPTKDSLHTGP